jgi:RecB family exonuclease
MYQECPQKYKFKYIDGIPERPKHFFAFGQSVHLALEFFYSVKAPPAPSLEELLKFYAQNWVKVGYKDKKQEDQYFEDGKTILRDYYKKHIDSYHIPFFVEYGFSTEVEGVPITGKVDRVDRLPDGRVAILDYKTGKAFAKGRELTDSQLTMYQMACEKGLGIEVAKLTLYHLPTNKEVSVSRHADDLVGALKEKIVKTAEGVTLGDFRANVSEQSCRWCDYKLLCPAYQGKPMESPAAKAEQDLAGMIDRYGETAQKIAELQEQNEALKAEIVAKLKERGYVRAFGKNFEIARAGSERWEFQDKKKVLELIKKAGLYDRVLAPSAPLVQQLMADPDLDSSVKSELKGLGTLVAGADLKVKPL